MTSLKELKMKLVKNANTFTSADTVFQRAISIFKFVEIILKNKESKKALDAMLSEANKEFDCYELSGEDNLMCEKLGLNCKFWWFYSNLDEIYTLMKRYKDNDDKKFINKVKEILSDDYAFDILTLSMKVVGGCIIVKMGKKEFIAGKLSKSNKTWFDDKNSILYVKDEKVLINKQSKETNAHKILKYIFKDNKNNLQDDFFFSEIAFDEFEDMEYKQNDESWRKYFVACREINLKVQKQTKNKINDFLIYNYGKKGRAKINQEYL